MIHNINMSFPRLEKGMGLIDSVKFIYGELHAAVPSSIDPRKIYHVNLRESTCECPDFLFRGVKCKHIRAVEAKAGSYS